MQVCDSPKFRRNSDDPVVIAIGAFDGFHLGHRKILKKTKDLAKKLEIPVGIYSFTPRPLEVIRPEKSPDYLISESQKINYLKKINYDYYFRQKFTEEFSKMKFDKFVKNILLDKIKAKKIVVGKDFKFGYKGKGDVSSLIKLGSKYNYEVTVVPFLKINNKKVSSSLIRNLIRKGKVNLVSNYLGNNFIIKGSVIHGEGRGKKLGYPTANLRLDTKYVLPLAGVYAGYVKYNGKRYKAVANFGYKPTFADENYSIEIHIINFNQNIYHENLSFELISFLRKEMNFSSNSQLIKQIQQDLLYTKQILC